MKEEMKLAYLQIDWTSWIDDPNFEEEEAIEFEKLNDSKPKVKHHSRPWPLQKYQNKYVRQVEVALFELDLFHDKKNIWFFQFSAFIWIGLGLLLLLLFTM